MTDESKEDQNDAAAPPEIEGGSLTPIEVSEDSQKAPLPLAPLQLVPYDPRPHHDQARRCIAYWLLGLLTFLLLATFACFGGILYWKLPETAFNEFKSVLEFILPSLLTLVSAATGFYFGSQHKLLICAES